MVKASVFLKLYHYCKPSVLCLDIKVEIWYNKSMVKVYYSFIDEPFSVANEIVENLPVCRREYVNKIIDPEKKRQSVIVWKLLEYALKDFAGNKNFIDADFYFDGKKFRIKNDPVYFSLSHSKGAFAVVISESPCATDIEIMSDKILRCERKILSLSGRNTHNCEYDKKTILAEIWTSYECNVKSGGEYCVKFRKLEFSGNEYMLAYSAKSGLRSAILTHVCAEEFLSVQSLS